MAKCKTAGRFMGEFYAVGDDAPDEYAAVAPLRFEKTAEKPKAQKAEKKPAKKKAAKKSGG